MAKTLVSNSSAPTHDEICARAYEIYLREGCVAGRDLDHWLQAEAELRNGNGNGNGHAEIAQAPSGNNDSAKTIATAPPAAIAAGATRGTTPKRAAKR